MLSVVLRKGGGEVQDGALWATRRTGSSSRELRGAVGSSGGTMQGRSMIGRVPCFQRCSAWGEGVGGCLRCSRTGAGLKPELEGSKMQEVKPGPEEWLPATRGTSIPWRLDPQSSGDSSVGPDFELWPQPDFPGRIGRRGPIWG